VLIDEKYLLNYRHGVISSRPESETIIYDVDIDRVVKHNY